jgi:hypothetical protein
VITVMEDFDETVSVGGLVYRIVYDVGERDMRCWQDGRLVCHLTNVANPYCALGALVRDTLADAAEHGRVAPDSST